MVHGGKLLVLVLLVAFSVNCVFRVSAELTSLEAKSVVDDVGVSLGKAFVAVADAEAAGADVTELKAKLTQSGVLLAKANASLSIGNYTDAVALALQANDTLNGVQSVASQLAAGARESGSVRFDTALLESVIGVALAGIFVAVGWVYFRRYYVRRVLSMKPEVTKAES